MTRFIGAVVHEDTSVVFRIVYPVDGDPEDVLDDPQWVTLGVSPDRRARLVKLDADNPDWGQFSGIEESIRPGGFKLER